MQKTKNKQTNKQKKANMIKPKQIIRYDVQIIICGDSWNYE